MDLLFIQAKSVKAVHETMCHDLVKKTGSKKLLISPALSALLFSGRSATTLNAYMGVPYETVTRLKDFQAETECGTKLQPLDLPAPIANVNSLLTKCLAHVEAELDEAIGAQFLDTDPTLIITKSWLRTHINLDSLIIKCIGLVMDIKVSTQHVNLKERAALFKRYCKAQNIAYNMADDYIFDTLVPYYIFRIQLIQAIENSRAFKEANRING